MTGADASCQSLDISEKQLSLSEGLFFPCAAPFESTDPRNERDVLLTLTAAGRKNGSL